MFAGSFSVTLGVVLGMALHSWAAVIGSGIVTLLFALWAFL